jgi:cbb3-type cytochrome oxidase maturation protein
MKIIILLLTVSLLVALVFLIAFFVALSRGQFDDCHTPAVRMLFDEEPKPLNTEKESTQQTTKSKES